jgi:phosphoribosylformimino-5-aminoimidazole carboxamide ribotide isomerase
MIEIIPAIDLIEGKCVRLMYGDFDRKTVYSDDPLQVAKRFDSIGITRLHIVDLDGARSGSPVNLSTLERVVRGTNLKIDFGGGIKSETDLTSVFDCGAAIATIGSLAVKEPALFRSWIRKYGGDRFLLGADSKDGKIAIDGWQTITELEVLSLLSDYVDKGITHAFVTDIERDGAMTGPSSELYEEIISSIPDISLIASGGVSSVSDIYELDGIGCSGVIVGRAIYEGTITLEDLTRYVG